ncbi:hypothetical protein DRP53_04110 [candidate division WOR-3 bacterium]|uniref:Uncharacterized protein n=1 Tax=candidate division WOR-3 bacterium TaxID=2052148 RepID=A0A660SIS6_UNCW3|nr:MAG: hypothetical protein DRP53_04110 [candidate division WOR-3 bacterium]
MELPYGEIDGDILKLRFSTADFSIASVLSAIRLHLDMIEEMGVAFLGAETEVTTSPQVFTPIPIVATFQYLGKGKAKDVLERVYRTVWAGVVNTFPDEPTWACAKKDYGSFITAQADLLRARVEALKAEE